MSNLLLCLRFCGTNYHGWQVQNNSLSIQQVFQDAVEKVYGARLDVCGVSRTDSGVHANMYCLNYHPNKDIPADAVCSALNMYLPDDIAVYACREVPEDFHARYSAKEKEYIYKIWNGRQRDPFMQGLSLHWRWRLDEDALNRAAADLTGRHDFSAFCSAGAKAGDKVRTVTESEVTRQGDLVTFRVRADGFLYNMVRIMTGTLLKIARGEIPPDAIPDIIDSQDRGRAGFTAAPCGLYLNKVIYEGADINA